MELKEFTEQVPKIRRLMLTEALHYLSDHDDAEDAVQEGLHILRLNTTKSIFVPYDWIHIKKCVDFDYEYCDLTKEGA